jgi:hypothetical protein
MRKWNVVAALILMCAVSANAAKLKGSGTLKDVQPAGTPEKKEKQQYDLTFVATANEYTCRTSEKEKFNAVNFVVGSTITYEISSNKAKLKNASGKEEKCTIVRVQATAAQK